MKTLFCTFNPTRDTDDEEYESYWGTENQRPGKAPLRSSAPAKEYAYLYTGNRDINAGDYAVVHNGSNFAVTKIERVKPGIDDRVRKHVLSVITQEDYTQYLKANKGINDHRKVFEQLDFMLEEQEKFNKYIELGKANPAAAALLHKAQVWHGPVIEAQSDTPVYDAPPKAEEPYHSPFKPEEKVTPDAV